MNKAQKNQLFQNNLDFFSKRYPEYAEKFKNKEYKKEENIKIGVGKAYSGELIIYAEQDGMRKYLAGKYAPERSLLDWIEKQDRVYNESIFFIVGIGNWLQIKAFLQSIDKKIKVIIYEPSVEIFTKVMEIYDVAEVLEQYEVGLVIEQINPRYLEGFFSVCIHRENMSLTKIYISGNYMELFYDLVKSKIEELKKYFETTVVNWNTMIRYTDVVGANVLNNIAYFYHGYSAEQFKNILPENVPAIIVSAGPSLNKNIDMLADAVGKCCIIATDTAIKPLLNKGIYPNFVAIVDGKKPALLFEHPQFSNIPLLTCVCVAKSVMNLHQGKKVFYLDGDAYEESVIKAINSERETELIIPALASGGSVANTAFSFAYYLGAKNIILIGQDLAMTGNKTHADGTFKEKMDTIDAEADNYIEVEDIFGEKVITRGDFDRYRKWFEDNIKTLNEAKAGIQVIDATEGGAKIHGTKIMTLKEAIKEFCVVECPVDNFINNMPEMLLGKDKECILEFFADTVVRLEEVRDKARKGIKYYDKMLQLSQKRVLNVSKYLELCKDVKNVNDYMDSDSIARFVTANLGEMENAMLSTMNLTEENERDERIIIAKKGKIILETMIPAIDRLLDMAKETIVPYKGDDSILHARYQQDSNC